MRAGTIPVKITATAAGGLAIMAGIYLFTYILFYDGDKQNTGVSAGPYIVDGESENWEFSTEDEMRSLHEGHRLDRYFDILNYSDESTKRRSAAFRLSYLATPDVEQSLLVFLTDSDEEVARHSSEALTRIWRKSGSQRANRFFEHALQAWYSGETQKTKTRLRNIEKLDPEIPDLHRLMADALLETGDINAARRAAEKAVKLKPEHFRAHYTLARCKLLAGEKEAAMEHIDEALRIYPTYKRALEFKQIIEAESGS